MKYYALYLLTWSDKQKMALHQFSHLIFTYAFFYNLEKSTYLFSFYIVQTFMSFSLDVFKSV